MESEGEKERKEEADEKRGNPVREKSQKISLR